MLEIGILFLLWAPPATLADCSYTPCNLPDCTGRASDADLKNMKIRVYNGSIDSCYTDVPIDDCRQVLDHTDNSKPTLIFIGGWLSATSPELNDVFLRPMVASGLYNGMELKWWPICNYEYPSAAASVYSVACKLAKAIDEMVAGGLNTTLILVGHSLGAHIAGKTGACTSKAINTLLGLDPAGPLFADVDPSERLNPSNAEFVLVIHTNRDCLGINKTCGHVDAWPDNGDRIQEGCASDIDSHNRPQKYLAESLANPNAFIGRQCDSEYDMKAGSCSSNPTAFIGLNTPSTTRGQFWYSINRQSPYGKGDQGAAYQNTVPSLLENAICIFKL